MCSPVCDQNPSTWRWFALEEGGCEVIVVSDVEDGLQTNKCVGASQVRSLLALFSGVIVRKWREILNLTSL